MKSILHIIKKRRWYLVIPLIILVLVIFGNTRTKNQKSLKFEKPQVGDLEAVVEVSGKIQAGKTAQLKFLGGGKLTYLGVKEGQRVRKYQTLASIDSRDLQTSLKSSLNTYLIGRANLDQSRYDNKDEPLTDSVRRILDKAQWAMDNNVLDVELKNLAIQNSSLYSPIEGLVTHIPTNVAGMQVSTADYFEIVDPATLEFVGEVDEVDIGKIQLGQKATITLDAYPNEKIDALINDIALKATTSTSSTGGTVFLVSVTLDSPDIFKYRLGLNGSMRIVVASAKNVLNIPLSATIQKDDNKIFVTVKKPDGKPLETEEKEIKIGIESDERVQVISGLKESEEFVITQ